MRFLHTTRPGSSALIAIILLAVAAQGANLSQAAAPGPHSSLLSPQSSQAATPFLTLPFEPHASMSILSGWYYSSSGGLHNGIDYINGSVNSLKTWKTFPILASADGEACGNCSGRQGNAVWIKHKVNGATYYTYYGHLASISPDIPIGSQSRTLSVKRGQFLGMAGDTGAGSGVLHLHFALYNAGSQPLDPYGIGKLREHYPAPHEKQPGMAWFLGDKPQSGTEAPPSSQPQGDTPASSDKPSGADDPPTDNETPKSDEEPEETQGESGGGDNPPTKRYRSGPYRQFAY